MLLEMKVVGLALDPMTQMPILILKDLSEEHTLPIWIGLVEAGAIATELEHIQLSRPMTHDLLKTILDEAGVQLLHVEVTDLRESTYYAALVVQQAGRVFEVDARPSDAIALALRAHCPIRVEESVLEKAREIDLRRKGTGDDADTAGDVLASLPDEDFGKWKM
jgi:uncharacterized protein